MKFRTDISFLRAISVLMVMFFHFGITGFSGGFIGVDIFFVISGFLMTQITLKAFEQNRFSIKEFYIKRIKRIVPALQFMLLFVLVISVLFLFEANLRLNAKYVLLANIFASNIYFWQYQNYFASDDNILLHTWSLGVEWQFYLIYPLILLMLKKVYLKDKRRFWFILSALMLGSLGLMLSVFKTNNNFAFYMLPTRFWELSIGGLAYGLNSQMRLSKIWKNILVITSVPIILVALYSISESNIWPSPLTMIPVFATAVILIVNIDTKLFNNKVVKTLGDLSYSLYLWHWPWYILFKYFGLLDNIHIILLIGISFLSAWLSFKFVEQKRFFSNIKATALFALLLAVISSLIFAKADRFKSLSLYQNERFQIVNFAEDYKPKRPQQFNPCGCFVTDDEELTLYNEKSCLQLSDTSKNILLLGDSHMAQFASAFRTYKQYNWLEVSFGYILPITSMHGNAERKQRFDEILAEYVFQDNSKIDLVIISAHWLMRSNPRINISEREMIDGLKDLIEALERHKIKYLIIGQSEAYTLSYPKIEMLKHFGRDENKYLRPESALINAKLKATVNTANYIDIYQHPLLQKVDTQGKVAYMYDGNHYSSFGANQVVSKIIIPRIQQILNEQKTEF